MNLIKTITNRDRSQPISIFGNLPRQIAPWSPDGVVAQDGGREVLQSSLPHVHLLSLKTVLKNWTPSLKGISIDILLFFLRFDTT